MRQDLDYVAGEVSVIIVDINDRPIGCEPDRDIAPCCTRIDPRIPFGRRFNCGWSAEQGSDFGRSCAGMNAQQAMNGHRMPRHREHGDGDQADDKHCAGHRHKATSTRAYADAANTRGEQEPREQRSKRMECHEQPACDCGDRGANKKRPE